MKNFKHFMIAVVALVMGVAFASCENDPTNGPESGVKVEVKVASVTAGGVSLEVVTRGISEFAYTKQELPESAILGGGQLKTIAATDVETVSAVNVYGYDPQTTDKLYFAFRKADGSLYGKVVVVEFTTAGVEGTLTVLDRRYDGFAVNIKVPDEVIERGNALRYSTTSLPMYNYSKMEGSIEIDLLLFNAEQYTLSDRVVRYDSYNSYERDEEGNIIDGGGEYSDPKVPGEPGIFMVGEYSYMDNPQELIVYMDMDGDGVSEVSTIYPSDDFENMTKEELEEATYILGHAIWNYPAGWDPGYYRPEFDWLKWCTDVIAYDKGEIDEFDSESYWTGYYERIQVDTLEPETLAGNVEITPHDLKPIDGAISFTPSDDVAFYAVMLLLESDYQTLFLPLIDNNEDYIRWFTGSYFGMYTFGQVTAFGNSTLYISEWFKNAREMAGQEVRVLVAGMGDNEGLTQCFNTLTFRLPEITKPDPQVVVTPVESGDPYVAMFNIKAPNKDAYEVYFACDYVREFNAALKDTSYLEIMKSLGAGNKFNNTAVEQINSEAGFTFAIASRENASTRLAVLVYNDEGSYNRDINETGTTAVAETTTKHANYPERVNSPLFEELVGEWVATAPMSKYVEKKDAEGNVTGGSWESAGTMSSTVTISGGVSYPEVLPKEVYDLYAAGGYNRDAVDELYDEFKSLADDYNKRTRGFNRLLCLGYNFAEPDYMLDIVATPYDLFIADDYSASQVSYMFYDFGPKWNFEIDGDGNVWLPIDIEKEFPLEAFNFGLDYTFYMLGISESSYIGAPIYNEKNELVLDSRFPVEVSEDRNTITIKPIEYTYKDGQETVTLKYYPCVAQLQYGQATPLNPRVGGDVVLTRKSGAKSSVSNASFGPMAAAPAVSTMGTAPVPAERTYSITPLKSLDIKKYQVITPAVQMETGAEAFKRRANDLVEKTYGITID
jgi:hypothetical protein